MQISNRTIAMLLIATIIVYLGGTFISLNRLAEVGYPSITGFGTSTGSGNVSVEISSQVAITWTVASIQWGAGYVDSSCNSNCTMQVNNTASAASGTYGYDTTCCKSFNWSNTSLLLKNSGNQNVNLQMNVTSNNTMWFGSATPAEFSFKIVDVKDRDHDSADNPQDTIASCLGNNTHANGWWDYESASTWTALDTWTLAPKYICGDATGKNFTFGSAANEANFDFKVVIPQSYSSTGVKSALIQILATS